MNEEHEEAIYMYKESCNDCGSSDACAVYSNGNTHCFSCGRTRSDKKQDNGDMVGTIKEYNPSIITYPDSIRSIRKETLDKFSYGHNGDRHITYYFNESNEIVAEKYRTKDKGFSWLGNAKAAGLFGQQLWKPHKKISITITEGEIDAMSISQLQQNKYPVVSVPNGAAAAPKDVKKSLEWLLGFKEVVLCFDNDKVGIEAANKVAKLFPPKFVRIASLPLKDANEMMRAGKEGDLSNALRDAKPFTPDGILSGASILDRIQHAKEVKSFPFPDFLARTNQMTEGIRMGEIDVYTSATGSGKTTLMKQLQHHYFTDTDLNQAVIHLEETLETTVRDLVSVHTGTKITSPKEDMTSYIKSASELFTAVDSEGNSRFQVYDSFGSLDVEDLYNKIRFMVNGLNCKVIWLDHLSIIVSGMGVEGDERRQIDNIMHNLKALTVELNCYIGLVSHLNNNTQTPFEEGGIPTVNNLRGSGGIKQLSHQIYAFVRNQQAADSLQRNTSTLYVLKNRHNGETGKADSFVYNAKTGRLDSEGSFEGETVF